MRSGRWAGEEGGARPREVETSLGTLGVLDAERAKGDQVFLPH